MTMLPLLKPDKSKITIIPPSRSSSFSKTRIQSFFVFFLHKRPKRRNSKHQSSNPKRNFCHIDDTNRSNNHIWVRRWIRVWRWRRRVCRSQRVCWASICWLVYPNSTFPFSIEFKFLPLPIHKHRFVLPICACISEFFIPIHVLAYRWDGESTGVLENCRLFVSGKKRRPNQRFWFPFSMKWFCRTTMGMVVVAGWRRDKQ